MEEKMKAINLKEAGAAIPNLYQYQTIARVNDHTFTLVRVKERRLDFHIHEDSDELFFIVSGNMELEFRDTITKLKEGDMCLVPRGTEHRPICTTEVTCLLVERRGTLTPSNTGGSYGENS
ncbi:MAG: cupin domain-containing protein [Desulfobacteraceae bacterium]|nr:MAG: cupin domain-containing protein [Desulfobacteraceae bacterium]